MQAARPKSAHRDAQGREKIAWQTKADARRKAKVIAKIFHDKMDAYQCEECGLWHLGHDRTRP